MAQNCALLSFFAGLVVYSELRLLLICMRSLDYSIGKSLTTLTPCTVSFRANFHQLWPQGSCRSLWTSIRLFRICMIWNLPSYWSLVWVLTLWIVGRICLMNCILLLFDIHLWKLRWVVLIWFLCKYWSQRFCPLISWLHDCYYSGDLLFSLWIDWIDFHFSNCCHWYFWLSWISDGSDCYSFYSWLFVISI